MSLGKIFVTEMLKVARVGVGAYSQSQQAQPAEGGGGRRKRRKMKTSGCTPCDAMAMADDIQERVRDGKLL